MDLSPNQLAAYRDKKRVLLVFAPSADDIGYREQKGWLEAHESDLQDRDLLVFYLVSSEAGLLREHFGVAENSFTVVLVGKDGGEKARYSAPVQPDELFGRVDQMPMRRREMAEE